MKQQSSKFKIGYRIQLFIFSYQMKLRMQKIVLSLIIICVSTQVFSQKHGFKRFQYDEFVYGLTVPKLKNIKAIADYYKITENEISEFNQLRPRFFASYRQFFCNG